MGDVYMANQVIDELRALLFGEEPYTRSRAPEPELFVELVPILPQSILDNVARSIPSLGGMTENQRALLFVALVERFPEAERRELLRRWFEENPEHAFKALSKLASRLPEPERVDLVKEVLAWARTLDSDKERAEVLASVGPLLDEPLRGKVLKEALATTKGISWESDLSRVLTELAPHLPKNLVRVAFESAEKLQNEHKVMPLAALAPNLPMPLLKNALETVFATVRDTDLDEERTRIFVEMARRLSEPLRSDVLGNVLSMIEAISWEEVRARALIELAPHLPEELLPRALILAQAIEDNWWNARAVSALYPFLAEADRKSIASKVARISGERLRQLLSQLRERERTALLEEAFDKLLEYYGGAPARPLAVERPRLQAAVCSDCGQEVEVPFKPDPNRPVFCRDCWIKRRESARKEEKRAPIFERERARVVSPPQERIVNTGFSSQTRAGKALDPAEPLAPEQSYYFWFEVGPPELAPGSIEVEPGVFPVELLPLEARLKVVLFAFEDEIEITPGRDVGEIQVMPDGKIRVVRQVEHPDSIPSGSDLLKRRLFFPVRTPSVEGNFRLRCNIYYEQILVQSRLIQARVAIKSEPSTIPALQSTLEYAMSKSLNPSYLVRMRPQKLSLMLNSNGDGTHCFRLVGAQDYKSETWFSVRTLGSLVEHARSALRQASWGDDEPWIKGKRYRYRGGYNQDILKKDLIRFAICGYRFWARFTQKIAGGKRDSEELINLMLRPATLEFAIKDVTEASDYMFPVAMIYDYPLDTNLDLGDYTLCPSFLEALEAGELLEETSCFKGDCPSRGDLTVVCPSGFWGFRHSIGVPLGSASETNHEMTYENAPELTVAVFPSFKKWPSHQRALKSLKPGMVWNFADTRLDTFAKLQSTNPHLVYFYCHGGVEKNIPYIKVGADNEKGITPDNLLPHGIWWDSPQPLVFINGCHTTALGPKMVLDFVASFVISLHAAGVIGTEISIFEPLACAFAEECLRRFLAKGEAIGDAVRMARLKLLEQGNPLGLIYIVYANASLRLEEAHA